MKLTAKIWNMEQKEVSLWSVAGRLKIPFVCGEQAWALLQTQRGETDLCFVRGQLYLYTTCDVEEATPLEVETYLGVDLGLVNVATDSDNNRNCSTRKHTRV